MRTPTPASVLRELASECERQADAAWIESDRMLEAATRMRARARELRDLAEAQDEAARAQAEIGSNVVAIRRRVS